MALNSDWAGDRAYDGRAASIFHCSYIRRRLQSQGPVADHRLLSNFDSRSKSGGMAGQSDGEEPALAEELNGECAMMKHQEITFHFRVPWAMRDGDEHTQMHIMHIFSSQTDRHPH